MLVEIIWNIILNMWQWMGPQIIMCSERFQFPVHNFMLRICICLRSALHSNNTISFCFNVWFKLHWARRHATMTFYFWCQFWWYKTGNHFAQKHAYVMSQIFPANGDTKQKGLYQHCPHRCMLAMHEAAVGQPPLPPMRGRAAGMAMTGGQLPAKSIATASNFFVVSWPCWTVEPTATGQCGGMYRIFCFMSLTIFSR